MTEPTPASLSLAGRTAVVAGAASDIGAAIARVYAELGANVVLGDIDPDGLAAARDAIGPDAVAQELDVTQRASVEALVALATERFGRLDVMANTAGVIVDRPVLETSADELERVLDVNLKGVFFGCQAAGAAMAAQEGGGAIVNMASLAAFGAMPNLSAYAMSKAGVVSLTRVLATELGPSGVRVNAVAPGYVASGMTVRNARNADGSVDSERAEKLRAAVEGRTPLRQTGVPDDVAGAFAYLSGDVSRQVTGQVIHVNGGTHMP